METSTAPAAGTPVYSTRRNRTGIVHDGTIHVDRRNGVTRPYIWVDFSEHYSRKGHIGGVYLADLQLR
jgi:hypothetical protein